MRFKSLFTLALTTVVGFAVTSNVQAQDTAVTRNVVGKQQASGSEVAINQIDTSAFPKVTIFATVLKDGVPQKGLVASDFRVREDEVDQEPLTVVPKLTPLSVVVALDTSGSMSKSIAQAKDAAVRFIQSLEQDDHVLGLGFAREVKVLSTMSSNKASAETALQATTARGDTALFDALYTSVEVLKDRPGRKAVILLSDGVDDNGYGKQLSAHSVQEVLTLAKEVNVPIFTIGLGTEIDEMTLRRVGTDTGAAYYNAPTADQLKALYDGIGKQLSGQYNIFYTSNLPGDGSMHRVQLGYQSEVSMKEYQSPNLPSSIKNEAVEKTVEKAPVAPPAVGALKCQALSENKGIGVIRLTASTDPSEKPQKVNQWEVFKAEPNGFGEYEKVGSSYNDSPKFELPTGKYIANARYEKARGKQEFEIAAGNACSLNVIMPKQGVIKLAAVTQKGGSPLKVNQWEIFSAQLDGLGEREKIDNSYNDTPYIYLLPGDYVVQVRSEKAYGKSEINVQGGDQKLVEVILPVQGKVRLVAVDRPGGTQLKVNQWTIFKAEKNGFGEYEKVDSNYNDIFDATLLPGKYIATVRKDKSEGRVEFEVTGGDSKKVEVVLSANSGGDNL